MKRRYVKSQKLLGENKNMWTQEQYVGLLLAAEIIGASINVNKK